MSGTTRQDKVGDVFEIYVNQGKREALVLAADGDELIVEYIMPSGTSALRHWKTGSGWKSVSYHGLPTKWLRLVIEGGQGWEGKPQSGGPVPAPDVLLAQREGRAG